MLYQPKRKGKLAVFNDSMIAAGLSGRSLHKPLTATAEAVAEQALPELALREQVLSGWVLAREPLPA